MATRAVVYFPHRAEKDSNLNYTMKELENLKQEIIQDDSDSYDIKADENSYLDSLEDDARDDIDSLIN